MTTGKSGVPTAAVSRCRRRGESLPILPSFANLPHSRKCGGVLCLPCAKGGGTAYAVTEGLSYCDFPNNPSVAFGDSSSYAEEPPLRRD